MAQKKWAWLIETFTPNLEFVEEHSCSAIVVAHNLEAALSEFCKKHPYYELTTFKITPTSVIIAGEE